MTQAFCSLEGRTALVTGASKGIGRAIATELSSAGASVVLSYRTGADEAQKLASELGARAVQADVSDPSSAQALVEEAGEVDILVNNAGVTRDGLLVRMDAQGIDESLDRALTGVDAAYIALDLDVLDPEEADVFMPEPDGMSVSDLESLLEDIVGRTTIAGIGMTGFLATERNAALVASLPPAAGF